ncbi:hypothetical protein DCS_04302 [Drechmeria coniospora]|uniref:Ecp2 effector protein domain-containing protein n=1 Tax=Drechmeria coniospora TaxID=98403 RepID=A0A151GJL2_DRECN|nr:hypothetical protein DCS_04302 [Drechmeria coniospora]KYK57294.1 hypothetical protein DCS_04302 [Drechmeria coniospora]ODA79188.1 hypothetical protein RJ55_04780 [Drechmeria coniospora]
MISPLFCLLALVGVGVADRWVGMESLPDGLYSGQTHDDGSTTMTSLQSGAKFTFPLVGDDGERAKRSVDDALAKRDTSCWGYELDHDGVDEGVVALKNWAGNNGQTISSGDTTSYFGFNRKGVYVYYCINQAHSQGNLDINDINYALRNMDGTCRRYEAGYFLWPGTPELVGKCRSGTAVCLG